MGICVRLGTDKRREIDAVAMEAAMAIERERGWTPVDVSSGRRPDPVLKALRDRAPNLRRSSFDIFSTRDDGADVRFIEVKGRSTSGPVEIIERERLTGVALGDDYWLYVVFDCRFTPRVVAVQRPMQMQWEPYPGNAYAKSPDQLRYTLSREQIELR
jgi:Domain of unknown function (DUF3883)